MPASGSSLHEPLVSNSNEKKNPLGVLWVLLTLGVASSCSDVEALFDQVGASHFSSLFTDTLHVATGVSTCHITVLDVRRQRVQTTWGNQSHAQARLSVSFEIRFSTQPTAQERQRVYDGVATFSCSLHCCAPLPFVCVCPCSKLLLHMIQLVCSLCAVRVTRFPRCTVKRPERNGRCYLSSISFPLSLRRR